MYIFFLFLFCGCVCICFFVWFCQYSLAFTICPRVLSARFCFFSFSIVFSTCYHWWICFWVWLLSSFFLFFPYLKFFFIFNNFFIFYFNNFILFNFFFLFSCLSFFLPFLLSHEADKVFVLWLAVRPVPLRWESQGEDTGPPETSRLQIISNSKSSPRDLHLNTKTQLHSMTSKLQCWTPYAKQLARQEHNPTH